MTLLLLTFGGAFGAMARYKLGAVLLRHEPHAFPFGTFVINITGALLLGLLCGFGVSGNPYLLLGDGFCGAFTTFSTFTVESVQLIRGRAAKKAVLFIVLSVSAGIAFFTVGYGAAAIFKL